MPSPTICIDFGSSRTKVAWFDPETRRPEVIELGHGLNRAVIPTVFHLALPSDGALIHVGDDAAELADQDPLGLVSDIKRKLASKDKLRLGNGRPVVTRAELARELLTHIRQRCEGEVFHQQVIRECMLTVPVCFSEAQRDALVNAAKDAGFTDGIRLIDEPVAAAQHWLASQTGQHVSDHVIVVDIGGGTTDIAALNRKGDQFVPYADLPHAGTPLGGNDVDGWVADSLKVDEQARAGWRLRLASIKELLTKTTRPSFRVHLGGQSLEIPRTVVQVATRVVAQRAAAELSTYLFAFVAKTGDSTCPVLLAGGGSRLEGMKEALEAVAPGRVLMWNDGDFAIVKGGLYENVKGETQAAPSERSEQARPPIAPAKPAETAANRPSPSATNEVLALKAKGTVSRAAIHSVPPVRIEPAVDFPEKRVALQPFVTSEEDFLISLMVPCGFLRAVRRAWLGLGPLSVPLCVAAVILTHGDRDENWVLGILLAPFVALALALLLAIYRIGRRVVLSRQDVPDFDDRIIQLLLKRGYAKEEALSGLLRFIAPRRVQFVHGATSDVVLLPTPAGLVYVGPWNILRYLRRHIKRYRMHRDYLRELR